MFSNYQEIIKNWGLAVNSMGFTDNQVKNQMDSLSRRINKLKADLTGMVAQGGNSGLTEWLKECVTDLDNLARYLSTVSTSTYSFLGSMVKLAAIMFAVNRAMRMVRTSLNMVTASGATSTITSMSAAFSAATTAAGGLKAAIIALKNSISLLKATATFGISLALDLGIEALTSNINESTTAVQKQTEAIQDSVAVKRQQIEMYSQQEEFLDALLTAHQKLTEEIESSTTSDEKKKKLLEDRIETENQMANVVGWSAVQQMQADNWTDESTKKVRDNYKKATDDKKRALAEFISAKQQEALNNWQNAQDNLNTWRQETYEFCNGISDRIKALGDWANAYTAFYQMKEQFDQAQANSYTKQADELQSKIDEMNDRYNDPDYHMSNAEVVQYRNLTQRVAEMRKNAENAQEDVKGDRYNEAYHAGYDKIIAAADKATQEASNLVSGLNTSAPVVNDPNDLLQKWGSGEGAGGDVYDPVPSGRSSGSSGGSSRERKQKAPKEDWQYGDTTSQMFAELSKKFEATFDTRNGLDIAALSAIVTKLTGINTLEFDGVSDPFGTGGRNTWESGRLFYEKMAPYLAQGLTVPEALGHLTPGITDQDWKTWLNDKALFLRNHYDYNKNDQRFHDPNEQPGGLYDLGGYSGSVSADGQSYIGNDSDEAHLWELAVDAAGKARKVKNPLWYWLIMMHESARGKREAAKRNHNYSGMDGDENEDQGSDDNFTTKLANTIDKDFDSEPSSPEELANGMHAHGFFDADPSIYASDMRSIMSEGLIAQGGSASSTANDPNGILSGGYDVDDQSMYGLDSRYITMSGSWDNIENLQPYVRRLLNIIANRYYAATGSKLDITSLTGGDGHSNSPWGHYAGYKADLSIDNNGAVLKDILGDYGVSAAVESGTHYDVSFGQGNDGRTVDSASGPLVGDGTGTEAWNRYHNGPMQGNANSIRKPSFWNGRKSTLADFTRDQIAETIYDQDRQQKLYEARKKNIEYQMKIHGNTYELLRANDANEKAYYEAVEKNRKGWIETYDNLTDDIDEYLNQHVEIKNKLDGKSIYDMPQDELRKLADLTSKKDNEFKKFIDNLFKVREQLSNADSKLAELRVNEKIRNGYMTPEQDENFRLKRLEEWYNRTTSNKTDGEKYMDTHELYQSQIDIYNERLKRQRESLMDIRRRDQEQLEEYYESLDDLQNGKYNDKGELVEKGLAQYKGDKSDEAKDKIAELKAKSKDLKENIDQLSKHGSEQFQKLQKEVEDTEAKIREIAEKDDEVTKNLWSTIESDIDDMFFDIIKQGSSFKESWKKLWDDVAKIALQQIMRMTVNRWLFNARTTIDDAISNRNAEKNAAINAGAGLLANNASRFTTTPKRWTQVATGNPYLDRYNGVVNGNYFPMKSSGGQLTTSVNKSVQATSKLSAVTQKATALTNVSNTLTQTATAKDALNTTATTTNTAATQAQMAAIQANTEALIMAGTPKPSISLGGHAMGGLLSRAYANGGMIRGAGTGKSDSILAYLADKDRFVFLSNGEYVMTAEATSRIGKDNLDAMNYGAFADGGALNPTPYVPQISPRVAKRAEGVRVTNPNARMEQLMQEQTDTIRNMGNSDGSGNVVVLNTHASSDDVMNAIQRNPRVFQSILHNQKRHGFR